MKLGPGYYHKELFDEIACSVSLQDGKLQLFLYGGKKLATFKFSDKKTLEQAKFMANASANSIFKDQSCNKSYDEYYSRIYY